MPGTLTRWDPFAELSELRTRFERLLEEVEPKGRVWTPAVDVVRDDGHLVVKADVPGIKPEEIEIEVDDGMLTVTGEHEESSERRTSSTSAVSGATARSPAAWRSPKASTRRRSRPRPRTACSRSSFRFPKKWRRSSR